MWVLDMSRRGLNSSKLSLNFDKAKWLLFHPLSLKKAVIFNEIDQLYRPFIYNYVNYANISWESASIHHGACVAMIYQ